MEVDTPKLQLYLIQANIVATGKEGFDLPVSIKKISEVLQDHYQRDNCLYSFKVTGETKIIAVYEVKDVIDLERTVNGLTLLGNVDVVCDPLCSYEGFAKRLGVDDSLTVPSPRNLNSDQCLWVTGTIDYPGKTIDEFITMWRAEAEAALGMRKEGGKLELYKVCGKRSVHLFTDKTAEEFDELYFQLPLIKENGDNVSIAIKGLQNLDFYLKKIFTY